MRLHYATGDRTACGRRVSDVVTTRRRDDIDCVLCLASIQNPRLPPETEAGFQGWVTDLATLRGWRWYHTHDSRRSNAGFPDLVLVRGSRIIFAELKRERAAATPEQIEWFNALRAVSAPLPPDDDYGTPTMTVAIWRPSDRPTIEELLR